jgi:hypothetical protein
LASTAAELASPLKSELTNSSSQTLRIPAISVSAALRNTSRIEGREVGVEVLMVRSIIDTLGLVAITSQYDLIIRGGGKGGMYVGTRIDTPVTLPRSSGRTEAIAFAAPVVVGMIFPKTVRPMQTISMEKQSWANC